MAMEIILKDNNQTHALRTVVITRLTDTVAMIMTMMVGLIRMMTAMMMMVHLGGDEKDATMVIKMVGLMEMQHTSEIYSQQIGNKQ